MKMIQSLCKNKLVDKRHAGEAYNAHLDRTTQFRELHNCIDDDEQNRNEK